MKNSLSKTAELFKPTLHNLMENTTVFSFCLRIHNNSTKHTVSQKKWTVHLFSTEREKSVRVAHHLSL